MNAGGAAKSMWIASHDLDRCSRAGNRAAGDQHACDAGFGGTAYDLITVVIETVVSEIDADVDQLNRVVQFITMRAWQERPVLSFDTRGQCVKAPIPWSTQRGIP